MLIEELTFLPSRLFEVIVNTVSCEGFLEEIRIRKNRSVYIIIGGKNIPVNVIVSEEEMQNIVRSITRNSLYAYRDTIINGYISYEKGIRIGIIGSAGVENGSMIGIYDINELAIRLPNRIEVNPDELLIRINNKSALIYSPPGEGKTTLLRALIKKLSSGRQAQRVVVVDTRNELEYNTFDKTSLASYLRGYPRKNGIEIAVRTMNAQIIICDEIGDIQDAQAIFDAQGAGVPIIATCHGSSIADILSHTGIMELHRHHIFEYYVGIKRGKALNYEYTINTWGEANDRL